MVQFHIKHIESKLDIPSDQ